MQMIYRSVFAAALIVAGSVTSVLAGEIGRVSVNGSEVVLYDDKTWEYAGDEATAPQNCTTISSDILPVSICLDPDSWQLGNLGGAYEHSFYNKAHDMYVGLIAEKQVIELDAFKNAIITNAQNAAKLNKVKTLEDHSASISGHEFGHLVYSTTVNGIDVTLANFYTKFDGKGSLQIIAFAGSDQFDSIRPVIKEVIASVKVTE